MLLLLLLVRDSSQSVALLLLEDCRVEDVDVPQMGSSDLFLELSVLRLIDEPVPFFSLATLGMPSHFEFTLGTSEGNFLCDIPAALCPLIAASAFCCWENCSHADADGSFKLRNLKTLLLLCGLAASDVEAEETDEADEVRSGVQ